MMLNALPIPSGRDVRRGGELGLEHKLVFRDRAREEVGHVDHRSVLSPLAGLCCAVLCAHVTHGVAVQDNVTHLRHCVHDRALIRVDLWFDLDRS